MFCHYLLLKIIPILFLGALMACSSKSASDRTCNSNEDCFEGEFCFYGICLVNCKSDAECQAGFICVDGMCILKSDSGIPEDTGEPDLNPDGEVDTDTSADGGCSPACEAGEFCNAGACEACDTDSHCGNDCVACTGEMPLCGGAAVGCICGETSCSAGSWCNAGTCEACITDGHCGSSCVACSGTTPRCDLLDGCVCFTDADCNTETEQCSSSSHACVLRGSYQWHTFYGSPDTDSGNSIAVDSTGNIYVTGNSNFSWNGSGNQLPRHAHSGGGIANIFILKLNANGIYQWHTFFGTINFHTGNSLDVDNSGNVYVTGYSDANWMVEDQPFPLHFYSGGSEVFVLKLNGSGDYVWHTFYGSPSDDKGNGIIAANDDSIYVTGQSWRTWNGSSPGNKDPINPHSIPEDNDDIFILKLNGSGEYQWHTFYGSPSAEMGSSIGTDYNGSIYVTGTGLATWNVGISGPRHSFTGTYDIIVMRINESGAYGWHTFYGSSILDSGNGLIVDNNGDVYVTGDSIKSWNGSNYGDLPRHLHSGDLANDIFVLKLNGTGDYQWHTFYGGEGWDYGKGISLDNTGHIYVTGYSQNTWTGAYGHLPLHDHSTPAPNSDIFVLKLNGSGDYQWHTFYGSGSEDFGNSLGMDPYGNIYLTGTSNASWSDPENFPPLNPFSGVEDLFVLKLYQ